MSDKMVTKEKLVIEDEIEDIVEEIREDNKEILEILSSNEYKLWFNIITRAGKQLIDYFFKTQIKEIIPRTDVEKKETKAKTESLKFQNMVLVDQSEKAYKFRNEAFEICWFAKKGIKYDESTKELEVLGWWVDFVNTKGEGIEFKKES